MKTINQNQAGRVSLFLLSIIILAACTGQAPTPADENQPIEEDAPVSSAEETSEQTGDVKVSEPIANESISFPLTIKGEAKGTWYFEAYLPITILDQNGNVLIASSAEAKGDWMTEDFVPFELTVEQLDLGGAESGKILFEKSNPSGLPENAASYELPVKFTSQN